MRKLCKFLAVKRSVSLTLPHIIIYQDNAAPIASSKNPMKRRLWSRLRHVNVRVYHIPEFVNALPVVCHTQQQHADMATKALPAPLLTRHIKVAYGIPLWNQFSNLCLRDQLKAGATTAVRPKNLF